MSSTDSYQRLEKIGEGTYGIVYKAKNKSTNKIVALKKIRPENEEEGISTTTIREISILKNLNNNRIIKLMDVMYSNSSIYIVYEYLETDLRRFLDDCISQGTTIDKDVRREMARQMVEGVAFLHCNGILHRDLKPQNILIDGNGNIKLADFGLGRTLRLPIKTLTHDVITLWYRPPEILLGSKHYASSVDVWSLACILAELFTLKPIFPGDSEIDQLYKIFMILGTPDNTNWKNVTYFPNYQESFPKWEPIDLKIILKDGLFTDLIKSMLRYDPLDRVSALHAIDSPYFTNIDD
ncbi:Protein kinase PCTAIRE [Trachipleistophora hominis]|uniref:Cyclin-dependent kinase 1 n=1 Tax=Trachipleistophora hominis TaxID=72359 RepID=L7JRZ7_TRAHO|nr:Protein kinase PCTAIRE [Trachipleistophora hominis]